MQHKGEIIEKAVRESGYSITKLAKQMGKSRRWVYQIFDSANVPIDYILGIGKIIYHDFSEDVKDLRVYNVQRTEQLLSDAPPAFDTKEEEVEHWKDKYLLLLEQYHELLLKQKD
jgi:predicted transcriptional regulator